MKFFLVLLFFFYSFGLSAQMSSNAVLTAKAVTLNGDTIMLADTLLAYTDNLILVDYWASWCGPCLREMPHSKEMQKEFAGKKLMFLYLSTDKANREWLKAVKKIKINGIHFRLIAETKSQIQQAYSISGIPFYQVLGKNQELLINAAAWPSSEKLSKQILTKL